jgi:hypothetical protein
VAFASPGGFPGNTTPSPPPVGAAFTCAETGICEKNAIRAVIKQADDFSSGEAFIGLIETASWKVRKRRAQS